MPFWKSGIIFRIKEILKPNFWPAEKPQAYVLLLVAKWWQTNWKSEPITGEFGYWDMEGANEKGFFKILIIIKMQMASLEPLTD